MDICVYTDIYTYRHTCMNINRNDCGWNCSSLRKEMDQRPNEKEVLTVFHTCVYMNEYKHI
jgi:hypothetical protein